MGWCPPHRVQRHNHKAIALLTWEDSKAQMDLQSKDPEKCLLRNDNWATSNGDAHVYP